MLSALFQPPINVMKFSSQMNEDKWWMARYPVESNCIDSALDHISLATVIQDRCNHASSLEAWKKLDRLTQHDSGKYGILFDGTTLLYLTSKSPS